jgi:hypothetical protein
MHHSCEFGVVAEGGQQGCNPYEQSTRQLLNVTSLSSRTDETDPPSLDLTSMKAGASTSRKQVAAARRPWRW